MATIKITFPAEGQPGKILKWCVKEDSVVAVGKVLLLYHNVTPGDEDHKGPEKKLRARRFGRITNVLAKAGDIVQPGEPILVMEGCRHPTVMKDLCAECGVDLREEAESKNGDKVVSTASVPMVHSIPELKVCPELAEKIGTEDEQRLLADRKLVLLVDLDQTIVHTTNDNVPPDMEDVYHYQLYGPNSPWYHTRLRPGTRHFLTAMSELYELHICTFGARNYAHTVVGILDKDGVLFSHRILSRDECFDPALKTANLKALFPCGDDMVCIIDDREDVWQGCGNLVQVKPYHFFHHTGDIHAPPGLQKLDPPSLLPKSNDVESKGGNVDSKETVIKSTDDNSTIDSEKANLEIKSTDELPKEKNVDASDQSKSNTITSEVSSKNNKEVKETGPKISSPDGKSKEVSGSSTDDVTTNASEVTVVEEKSAESIDSEPPLVEERTESVSETSSSSDKAQKDHEFSSSGEQETEKADESVSLNKEAETSTKGKDILHIEDHDDYLMYLEDILRRIHAEFYNDPEEDKERKSLKIIIPRVRARILKGLYITFSGLIPTNQKLQQSRAYKVARAFGAEVTQDLVEETTHLVAIKPGTAKVNTAKKNPKIKIVNPDWLWTCAERWEHVDERVFPLTVKARGSRIPPPHCSSPERIDEGTNISDNFANTINPLMSFTQEEIDIMDKEVDEDMLDPESDITASYDTNNPESLDEESGGVKRPYEDDFDDLDTRKKWKKSDYLDASNSDRKNLYGVEDEDDDDDDVCYGNDEDNDDDNYDDDNDVVERFRRGGNLPDDLDLGENSQDDSVDVDIVENDNDDDREWNAMGAALEREFLSE